MGRRLSLEERIERQFKRYELKLRLPISVGRYEYMRDVAIENMRKWIDVRVPVERILKEVLDGRGIKGVDRIPYRNFALALFSRLRRWHWSTHSRVIRAFIAFYSMLYGLDRGVMKEIASRLAPIAKRLYIEEALDKIIEDESLLKYKAAVAETEEERAAFEAVLRQLRKEERKLKKELASL